MTVRIGTSGWQYDDWRGPVYPPGLARSRWLDAYAHVFPTVEANSAFYGLPSRATVERWAAATPDDFRWAVKASRFLTHVRRLRDPQEPVQRFVDRMGALGGRLGPVLLQLPPAFDPAPDRLAETLRCFPATWRLAVELRDRRWWRDDIRRVLEARGAAVCLADRLGPTGPRWPTAPWTYLRFHEGGARPWPCYGDDAMRTWARRLIDGWGRDADAWVLFNNDPRACAPRNAVRFGRVCERLGLEVAPIGTLPARVEGGAAAGAGNGRPRMTG